MRDKLCAKCESHMTEDRGIYTCEYCLNELIQVKRMLWESESGPINNINKEVKDEEQRKI